LTDGKVTDTVYKYFVCVVHVRVYDIYTRAEDCTGMNEICIYIHI